MKRSEYNLFEKTCRRMNGLREAENQIDQDIALCEIMQALTIVSKLTGLAGREKIRQRSPDACRALIVARHALEIAADQMTVRYPPVTIERISTDYADYVRNFGKSGYYPDPRD